MSAVPATALADVVRRVIPAGREAVLQELARPYALGGEVSGGWRLDGLAIEEASFSFVLARDARRVRWSLAPGRETVTPEAATLEPDARAALSALQGVVRGRVTEAFWEGLLVDVVERVERAKPRGEEPGEGPPPFDVWPWVAALAALLGLVLLERGGASLRRAAAAVGLVAGAAAVAVVRWGSGLAGASEVALQWRERLGVQLVLAVAATALVLGLAASVRRLRGGAGAGAAFLDATLVLGWSLVVRVLLTTPNVLTDGGSGWSRLLDYRRGFSGLAVLVDVVLPDRTMDESIWVPRLVAALLPPLVVLLGRVLGLSRVAAALAGLAIASLPVHAALYTSDFEVGAVVTLLALGFLLVAAARPDSAALFGAGTAVVAYALWGRPEALVAGLPLLVLCTRFPRAFWLRPAVAGAVVWLGVVALVRLAALRGLAHWETASATGLWRELPVGEWLTTSALFPLWLWLPLPLGLFVLRGRPRLVVVAGLVAGCVPFLVTPTMFDRTKTFLEVFRYGSIALPFVALAAGAGLAALCVRVAGLLRLPARRAALPAGLVVAAMVATPLVNRDYLAREYGPSKEARVFREALGHVPQGCNLVVPDDDVLGAGMLEVRKRYVELLREVDREGLERGTAPWIVGVSEFLRHAPAGRLPTLAELFPDAARPGAAQGACWVYFAGTYCNDGFEGEQPAHCGEFETRFQGAPLWTTTIEYRSHRLVTRPRLHEAPFSVPDLVVGLYRVGR